MADVEAWTKAARNEFNNSVVVAAPASSNPLSGGAAAEFTLEAAVDLGVVGAAIGAATLGGAAALSGFRRIKNRRKPVGEREVNDRVALVFYDDRVDVHRRSALRTTIGDLMGTHPLDAIEWSERNKMSIGGTEWVLSGSRADDLIKAIEPLGLSPRS